ncbi:MAG: dTDP-glucose 4,6-dehydratase [Candidatus Nanohaloarchaea archaeon]
MAETTLDGRRILVTGGAGFIGSNFVHYLQDEYDNPEITVLDKLTYAGSKENLEPHLEDITFVKGDIADRSTVEEVLPGHDFVVNFAAESHVDRSIDSGDPFVHSNVDGAYTLMDVARQTGIEKFIQISTDEVYGSIEEGKAKEGDPLDPSSPYSASKAAADMFANAMHTTYGFPVVIARPTNNYGPRQHPEKLIPKFITNALNGEELPLYGDGSNVRDWLYVKDTCTALELLLQKGENGDIYNIGGDNFRTNVEVTEKILEATHKAEDLISFVDDRKGHDYRYAVDSSKIRELGWESQMDFDKGLTETLDFYGGAD